MKIFGRVLDERFFAHRQRSTSIAGIVGCVLAAALWAYQFYVNHVLRWDLFAVVMTIAGVKMLVMAWYYITD